MSYVVDKIKHSSIQIKKKINYCIINYEKEKNIEDEDLFMYRSVILSSYEGTLLSFTTPKSTLLSKFIERNPKIDNNFIINEIIPGTMIQLFYDDCIHSWEIATKKAVGGNYIGLEDGKNETFRTKFLNACNNSDDNINNISLLKNLKKKYSYQFVLPDTKTHNGSGLYLVAVYKIWKNKNTAYYVSPIEYESWQMLKCDFIFFPNKYTTQSHEPYRFLRDNYCSIHSNANCMGIMITNKTTGERTKMLNQNYFERNKIQLFNNNTFFHFLCFLRMNKIKDFIEVFPQYTKEFDEFQKHFNTFVDGIFQSYIDFYVKKKVSIISMRYAKHIIWLHYNKYIPLKEKVTRDVVQKYVLDIESIFLMYEFYIF